jgi:hypothetical protein
VRTCNLPRGVCLVPMRAGNATAAQRLVMLE